MINLEEIYKLNINGIELQVTYNELVELRNVLNSIINRQLQNPGISIRYLDSSESNGTK